MKVYLGGPIHKTSHVWRNKLTKEFARYNVQVLNPQIFEFGVGKHFDLVRLDLNMISKSDAIFFFVDRPSTGTPMEMVYSFQMNKPTYTYFGPKMKDKISPWHQYHAGFQSTNLSKVLAKIRHDFSLEERDLVSEAAGYKVGLSDNRPD